MPRVLNKRLHGVPEGAVYVGRPSKWGNPFKLEGRASREDVIAWFEGYAILTFTEAELAELRGKDLVCWCWPQACHADVLLRLANP